MHGMLYRHTRTALVVIAATFCGATSERVHAQPVGEIAERRSDLDDLKKRIRDMAEQLIKLAAQRLLSSGTDTLQYNLFTEAGFSNVWGDGTGSEVMQRIAAPMVGGMISAPLLSLFVVPVVYRLMRRC